MKELMLQNNKGTEDIGKKYWYHENIWKLHFSLNSSTTKALTFKIKSFFKIELTDIPDFVPFENFNVLNRISLI